MLLKITALKIYQPCSHGRKKRKMFYILFIIETEIYLQKLVLSTNNRITLSNQCQLDHFPHYNLFLFCPSCFTFWWLFYFGRISNLFLCNSFSNINEILLQWHLIFLVTNLFENLMKVMNHFLLKVFTQRNIWMKFWVCGAEILRFTFLFQGHLCTPDYEPLAYVSVTDLFLFLWQPWIPWRVAVIFKIQQKELGHIK